MVAAVVIIIAVAVWLFVKARRHRNHAGGTGP
jgi:hypothetical protein